MSKSNTEWDAHYKKVSDKIASFAKRYSITIDKSVDLREKNLAHRILSRILLLPSNFFLAYNAVKRVKMACTHFSLALSCSNYGINRKWYEQNRALSETFAQKYAENLIPLLLSIVSSTLFLPALSLTYSIVRIRPTDFEGMITTAFLGFVFVVVYNYFNYDAIRKDFKKEFEQLKAEISALP